MSGAWRIALLWFLVAPLWAQEADSIVISGTSESAGELIEQVVRERALRALLAEQVKVAKLRSQIRLLEGESTSAAGPSIPEDLVPPMPIVAALWQDAEGPAASVFEPGAHGRQRRTHILREGEQFRTARGMLSVRRIGPEGVTVSLESADDEILLPY